MRKKLAAAVFAFLCCCMLSAAYAEAPDFVEINTPEGLQSIANDPHGNYVLTADIDMKGVEWAPVAFTGQFDGGGHTIYNLKVDTLGEAHAVTVDGNRKKYDTYFAGLFSVVRGAVIKDLNLLGVDVRISTDKNCFAAGLAGFAEDTAISGCSVKGRVYLYQTNWMCGVAGLVGFGYGTISRCDADVELVFVDGDTKIKCEEFLGGVLATGYFDIENCTVTLKGYASVQGYVHNGGVVGMHYIHTADRNHKGYVKNCSVDAAIFFYENNRDRRAYCKAVIGEKLNANVKVSGNKTVYFKNGETRDYSTVLLPEKCGKPVYTAAVTAPTCTAFGYTTHTCTGCGYTYTDDYVHAAHTPGEWTTVVAPTHEEAGAERLTCTACGKLLDERALPVLAHVPGDWTIVRDPAYGQSGLKQRHCTVCGKLLEEEEIPALAYVSSCKLDKAQLELAYKGSASLRAEVLPADAANPGVTWSSSDESVATVDGQGNVYAAGCGTAVITCASADGNASSACPVTVTYTVWQWIIKILLFGWIWY